MGNSNKKGGLMISLNDAIENLETTATSINDQLDAIETKQEAWDVRDFDNWDSMLTHIGEVLDLLKTIQRTFCE